MRLANPNNPSGANIEVQYLWQHDGGASAATVTSWGMIETQLTDIETKPGRAPYVEWKDGGKSDVEKRESGFAYLIFTEFAIVPIETTGEAKGKDGAGYLTREETVALGALGFETPPPRHDGAANVHADTHDGVVAGSGHALLDHAERAEHGIARRMCHHARSEPVRAGDWTSPPLKLA